MQEESMRRTDKERKSVKPARSNNVLLFMCSTDDFSLDFLLYFMTKLLIIIYNNIIYILEKKNGNAKIIASSSFTPSFLPSFSLSFFLVLLSLISLSRFFLFFIASKEN